MRRSDRRETGRSAGSGHRYRKAHIGIGMVYRGKLDKPARIRSRNTTRSARSITSSPGRRPLVLGRTSSTVSGVPRPCAPSVEFNGRGTTVRTSATASRTRSRRETSVVIPAGTGHWFTRIDDHISYLMVRIDPDKVTPLKGERSPGLPVRNRAEVRLLGLDSAALAILRRWRFVRESFTCAIRPAGALQAS